MNKRPEYPRDSASPQSKAWTNAINSPLKTITNRPTASLVPVIQQRVAIGIVQHKLIQFVYRQTYLCIHAIHIDVIHVLLDKVKWPGYIYECERRKERTSSFPPRGPLRALLYTVFIKTFIKSAPGPTICTVHIPTRPPFTVTCS